MIFLELAVVSVFLNEMTGRKHIVFLQPNQDCDQLGENSGLLRLTKCSGKNIFKVRDKSGNFISWLFEEKPEPDINERRQKCSKASNATRKI